MLQHRAVFSPIPLLCWSGLCARFPTMCHCKGDVRFLTLQQVSSGQTSRGKFCVSEQLHKQATFLHTNEGFLYAKGAASYLVSCKDLVFWPNSSSATCRAHKVLAICSEQKPLCSWGETRERSISISLCSHVPSHHPNSSLQIQRISVHSGGCPPMSLCCNSSYLTVTGLQIHLQMLGMDRNGAALLFINIKWKSSTKEKISYSLGKETDREVESVRPQQQEGRRKGIQQWHIIPNVLWTRVFQNLLAWYFLYLCSVPLMSTRLAASKEVHKN